MRPKFIVLAIVLLLGGFFISALGGSPLFFILGYPMAMLCMGLGDSRHRFMAYLGGALLVLTCFLVLHVEFGGKGL
jgi:hypothetical protein